MITHAFGNVNKTNLVEIQKMKLPELMEFEIEAQKLLNGGGIKNKQVAMIRETSRVIRDKIDDVLERIFIENAITPEFFITSNSFCSIWKNNISKNN